MSSDGGKTPDKTRLCPSCRCEISILATRCRFCGEEVGRPKDEARQFTIDDLGGESHTQYAPSGDVMDAIESFRMELSGSSQDSAAKTKSASSRKRRKTDSNPSTDSDGTSGGNSELDENNRTLASLSLPTYHPPALTSKAAGPSWVKKIGFLGGFIAALVILYLGGIKAAALIHGWIRPAEVRQQYDNRALEMMKKNAPAIDVFEEAAKAAQIDPNEENRRIFAQARASLDEQIKQRLNDKEWTFEKLREASAWAARAAIADPGDVTKALKNETSDEVFKYNMTLKEVEPDKETVLIGLNQPDGKKIDRRFKKGNLISGQFILEIIKQDEIIVRDTMRDNRKLTYPLGGAPRLYKE